MSDFHVSCLISFILFHILNYVDFNSTLAASLTSLFKTCSPPFSLVMLEMCSSKDRSGFVVSNVCFYIGSASIQSVSVGAFG